MSGLEKKVPEEVVARAFEGIMAISPSIYAGMVKRIAEQYGVPCDDEFQQYVTDVLAKQPPDPDW